MMRRSLLYRGYRKVNPWNGALPTEQQAKMCFGKRMMNKQQALQLAAYERKFNPDVTDALRPYKCRVCKHWHIGHDTYWKRAA